MDTNEKHTTFLCIIILFSNKVKKLLNEIQSYLKRKQMYKKYLMINVLHLNECF